MRIFNLVVVLSSTLLLGACTSDFVPNTLQRAHIAIPEGYHNRSKPLPDAEQMPQLAMAPTAAPAAAMPAQTGVKVPSGTPVQAEALAGSNVRWNTLSRYDATNPSLPVGKTAGTRKPALKVVKYNDSVSVYPVDGDMKPYMHVPPHASMLKKGRMKSGGKKGAPEDVAVHEAGDEKIAGEMVQQVFFGYGSDKVSKIDRKNLHELGGSLVKNDKPYKLSVVGHASKRVDHERDPVRREMINLKMAQKRANAVTHELKKAGVKPDWVLAMSKGDKEPNPKPGDKDQEAADRRAEVYMDDK